MHKLTIKGQAAHIKWGYHPAADLGSWTLTADAGGGTVVTASVVTADAFRVSQQPLTFVVPRPSGSWTWPITTLQFTGTTVSARLGPQEE